MLGHVGFTLQAQPARVTLLRTTSHCCSAPTRCRHDLSVFTVGYDSEEPSAAYSNPAGEEEGPASVSTLMLIAADKLHHMLSALAQVRARGLCGLVGPLWG